ncbi:MAG: hypothetical protein C4317_03050 [Acidimicrobiia bacterium]
MRVFWLKLRKVSVVVDSKHCSRIASKTWFLRTDRNLPSIAERLRVPEQALEAVALIRSAAAVVSQLEAAHWARYNLGAASGWVLLELALEGPTRPADLAASFLVTPGGMSQVIASLEKKGLVEKVRDSQDRRSLLVALTDKGRALFRKQLPELRQALEGIEEQIGKRRLEGLCTTLEDFLAALDPLSSGPE